MNSADRAFVPPAGNNIVLIGPMGSGKSSIARELAGLDRRRAVDTDHLVVDGAGASITEIFADYGEVHFRALETAALRSLAGSRGLVVATGGGIVSTPENIGLLRNLGCVVWLTARDEVLFERVSRSRRRPLLHTADPFATLRELVARRRPLYAACAHLTVDTSTLTHAEIADAVLCEVYAFFAGGERTDLSAAQQPSL